MAVGLCHRRIQLKKVRALDDAGLLQHLGDLVGAGPFRNINRDIDCIASNRQHIVDTGDCILRQRNPDEQHHHQPHQAEKELVLATLLFIALLMGLCRPPCRLTLRHTDIRRSVVFLRTAITIDRRRLLPRGSA